MHVKSNGGVWEGAETGSANDYLKTAQSELVIIRLNFLIMGSELSYRYSHAL